ncbi:coiled-coil domain-containing protein 191 [Anguilla anguilla]|uniref:coiled-coil domain-containing protein 191 n=1 Tax=Anguilla anguilla TaxID=7936 RepID=UPI0015A9E484|nr:coiled-coil domain-containing protein 191 [Anguilla anguilla]
MTHHTDNPGRFRWKRLTKNKAVTSKRVETTSELALSWLRTASKRINSQAVALQSTEQLHDHDEAYSEAQDLLNKWMSRKLHLELEEGEDIVLTSETDGLLAPPSPFLQHSNFNDLYSYLDQEADDCAVHNILQELMELEVVDSGMADDLTSDTEGKKTRQTNALVSMEIRHQLVRESRAQRDAERLRRHEERKLLKEVKEKAQWREQQEKCRRWQKERQQEELLQQEVVRLRRKMEEQRSLEQNARLMERERRDRETQILASLPPDLGPTDPKTLQAQEQRKREQLRRLQVVQSRVHMLNLRCLQNHFSKWYCAVLERRVRMGNAAALCDWRRQLRVWREWRSLVWASREEREAMSTEAELRSQTRRHQVALESDRRRVLRRHLTAWRILVQAERIRQDLLNQQVKTQHKMAALISAATSGKLGSSNTLPSAPCPRLPAATVPPETTPAQSQSGQQGAEISISAQLPPPAVPDVALPLPQAPPMQGRQGMRRQVAINIQKTEQRANGAAQRSGRKEECCKEQQCIVIEQDQHLGEQRQHRGEQHQHRGEQWQHRGEQHQHRGEQHQHQGEQRQHRGEQHQQISPLPEDQSMLKHQRKEQRTVGEERQVQIAPPSCSGTEGLTLPKGPRHVQQVATVEHSVPQSSLRPRPCPVVTAMEERARQRAERKREVEEMKRRKEEEKQALIRMEEERMQQELNEEKKREADRRREKKRLEREKELERQQQAEREKQMWCKAVEHHHRALLLRHGLLPLQRLLEKSRSNTQRAEAYDRASLQRRCLLAWVQAAGKSVAKKNARAARTYRRILLRRSLRSWLKMKERLVVRTIRAERFCRTRTLRRTLMALRDHVARERLAALEKERQAKEHWLRCVMQRCFWAWRGLPHLLREERGREERREQLRRRVAEILPDFNCSPRAGAWGSPPPLSNRAGR